MQAFILTWKIRKKCSATNVRILWAKCSLAWLPAPASCCRYKPVTLVEINAGLVIPRSHLREEIVNPTKYYVFGSLTAFIIKATEQNQIHNLLQAKGILCILYMCLQYNTQRLYYTLCKVGSWEVKIIFPQANKSVLDTKKNALSFLRSSRGKDADMEKHKGYYSTIRGMAHMETPSPKLSPPQPHHSGEVNPRCFTVLYFLFWFSISPK